MWICIGNAIMAYRDIKGAIVTLIEELSTPIKHIMRL